MIRPRPVEKTTLWVSYSNPKSQAASRSSTLRGAKNHIFKGRVTPVRAGNTRRLGRSLALSRLRRARRGTVGLRLVRPWGGHRPTRIA